MRQSLFLIAGLASEKCSICDDGVIVKLDSEDKVFNRDTYEKVKALAVGPTKVRPKGRALINDSSIVNYEETYILSDYMAIALLRSE